MNESKKVTTEIAAIGPTVIQPANQNEPNPDPDDDTPTPTPSAPAMRLRIPESTSLRPDDNVERLRRFNEDRLADINEKIQADPAWIAELEGVIENLIDWKAFVASFAKPHVEVNFARVAFQHLGFVTASMNRHYHAAVAGSEDESIKAAAGDKVAEFFLSRVGIDLGELISSMSRHARHPGHMSYYTYWLNNAAGINFTNDPGESYFRMAVNETNRLFAIAAEYVKPIQAGEVCFFQPQASKMLTKAAAAVQSLHDVYNFRLPNETTGQPRMTPEFFMKRMRGYLIPLRIHGKNLEGPNATYSPGWPRMDYALGNRSIEYVNTVQSRYPWMVPEHRILLDQVLDMPSLPEQLAHQLGLSGEDIRKSSAEDMRALIDGLAPDYRESVMAFAALVKAFNVLSATHLSMIRNYLTRPAEKMSEAERKAIVPSPDGGVGGNALAHTESILTMRRTHPLNAKILEAVRP